MDLIWHYQHSVMEARATMHASSSRAQVDGRACAALRYALCPNGDVIEL